MEKEICVFANEIKSGLEKTLAGDYEITIARIPKNNRELTGISVRKKDSDAGFTFYAEDMADDNRPREEILQEIVEMAQKPVPFVSAAVIAKTRKWSFAKDRIELRLVDPEKNLKLVSAGPHRKFIDLELLYYLTPDDERNTSFRITDDFLEDWGVTEAELFDAGVTSMLKYYPVGLFSLPSLAGEEEMPEEDPIPFVLTGIGKKWYTAAGILYSSAAEDLARKFGRDIYILPLSVNDLMLVPESPDIRESFLLEMLRYACNAVRENEYLSDRLYKYHHADGTYSIIRQPS